MNVIDFILFSYENKRSMKTSVYDLCLFVKKKEPSHIKCTHYDSDGTRKKQEYITKYNPFFLY